MKNKLIELAKNSYAPYSNFHVSCIVVMKDGMEFNGVNVENASYGATICAERSAITSAISAGYKPYDFESIHVYNDSDKLGTCCFICRQLLAEFFAENKIAHFYTSNLEERLSIKELCPYPFSKDNLD